MSAHDTDDEGNENCVPTTEYSYGSLQVLDLVAIGFRTLGHCTQAIGGGFHMLANEFLQAAQYKRRVEAELLARAEADYALRRWAALEESPMTTTEGES